MPPPRLSIDDLRGLSRLSADAVVGLADLVEAMHAGISPLPSVSGPSAAATQRAGGITGLVYGSVRGLTRLVGGSADALLGLLAAALPAGDDEQAHRPEREALLAALNGVLGDYLATTNNPLAIAMRFRRAGLALPLEPKALAARLEPASAQVLVLIHGLCMNDLQWRREGHDHGEALARELGFTPVYLHYNSGRHIADNGQDLALQLQQLVQAWPVAVQRLVLVGHSMGGLVARSALHYGTEREGGPLPWVGQVSDLICLGTPHQGAPLERAGHGVDLLLGAAPYAAPLARIGRLRSAGIQDLRHGRIVASPSKAQAPAAQPRLPAHARCHALAASLGPQPASLKSRLLGDGLVPLASALGRHKDAALDLGFAPERQAVVYRTGHMELLSSRQVYEQMRLWLGQASR